MSTIWISEKSYFEDVFHRNLRTEKSYWLSSQNVMVKQNSRVSKFKIVKYFKSYNEIDIHNYRGALSVFSLAVLSYSVIKNEIDFTSE